MIRSIAKRMYTTLNLPTKNMAVVYPAYNEISIDTPDGSDDGYRVMIDICHTTKTIYLDNDMCDYDKLNDLPRIIKTFGCLYPNYTLQDNNA
tara:strand:- start:374 stop:649 length:276 start_codon:yes stop_codon:yes gene_type:complete